MKNSFNIALILILFTSFIFTTSCGKESPLVKEEAPTSSVSQKNTVLFKANSQFDEYKVYFHVMRGHEEIKGHPVDVYFPMNQETVFSGEVSLQSGDQIFCYAKSKSKGTYITCSISIDGKLIKDYSKICSYGGFIYDVP